MLAAGVLKKLWRAHLAPAPAFVTALQAHYPPKDYPLPPSPGCDNHEVVWEVVNRINEAARTFPDWDAKVAAPQAAPQANPQPARRLLRKAAK